MSNIHSSAVIHDGADIVGDVEIGPYCVVGPNVVLRDGVTLISHVVIDGHTDIGEQTTIHPFAAIGQPPQDLKYAGESTRLIIGRENTIREHVTMHPGTGIGRKETVVGNNGMFMAGCHVAHDCIVGDQVIFANNATIGGYVTVGSFAFLGGLSAIHQFSRIGAHAFVGGMAGLENDLIPYGSCMANRAYLSGLNIVGMKRRGFDRDTIHTLRAAYRMLFAQEGTFQERIDDVAELFGETPEVSEIVDFIREESNRSICMPKSLRSN